MRKCTKRFLGIVAFSLLTFCFVSQLSAAPDEGPPTIIRYAGWHPIEHHCTRGQDLYARLIMEKTKK